MQTRHALALFFRYLGVIGAAMLLLASSARAEEIRDPETHFFDDTFGDMQEELVTASDEGKKALMIMFETDNCPWCMRMKQTVLNRTKVQDYFKEHFRIIKINAEGGAPIVDFDGNDTSETQFSLKLLRVRATPVYAFFDAEGKLLTKYTGTTKNVEDFMLLGEFVVGDHYKNQKFSQFRRAQSPKKAAAAG